MDDLTKLHRQVREALENVQIEYNNTEECLNDLAKSIAVLEKKVNELENEIEYLEETSASERGGF
ncbi:MAG: hypothetical protein GX892_14375 [Thermoanaerobacteraceae bacterium]|nr:hypothetical protein [Thermoanaerobacteraceae bacterium]